MSDQFQIFLTNEAFQINKARLEHLASLNLDLAGKRVLEVGAGIGLLSHFFEKQGCSVLSTDGRVDNVAEILRRFPHRKAQVLNLEKTTDLTHLGHFDIVFCYGTLYHLSNPEQALHAIAEVCQGMLLLETCVTPGNELAIHLESEDASNPNQAFSGMGCRPTRPWLMQTLKKSFGFAYLTKHQPCHIDFDLNWQIPTSKPLHRSVFVASRSPLNNPKLSEEILDLQTYEPSLREIWVEVSAPLKGASFHRAQKDPFLKVYSVQPDLKLVPDSLAELPNYVVIPSFLVDEDAPNSGSTISVDDKTVEKNVAQSVITLDILLEKLQINKIDYLNLYVQEADFDIVSFFGDRLIDCKKIQLKLPLSRDGFPVQQVGDSETLNFFNQQNFFLVHAESGLNNDVESLTFVRDDQLRFQTDLAHFIDGLDLDAVRLLMTAMATCYPLATYPGWYFNVAWDSPIPEVKTRQAIWQYFKAKQVEEKIKFNWYFDLCLNLYLENDLGSQLFIAGCIEPNEFYFLSKILTSGMTFVDIGANEGLYTLFAAKLVGSEGQVLAFEPSQRELNRLQDNLDLNQISHVKTFQLALSNTSGCQSLKIAEDEHSGQNTLGEFAYEGVACSSVEMVSVRPLDDVLKEIETQQVDVIKMDVEGAEFSVLQGARSTLEKDHPLLLLELVDQALRNQGTSVMEVLNFLGSLGYKIFIFGNYTGLPIPSAQAYLEGMNVIAAHPERLWDFLSEQAQIEHLQTELSYAQADASQSQIELKQTQENLEMQLEKLRQQVQQQVQQQEQQQQEFQQKLTAIREELERTQIELQQNKQVKEDLQAILEVTRNQVAAMESSKFWQLRQRWLNLKQKISPSSEG